jgi:uncharacterized protein YoxC
MAADVPREEFETRVGVLEREVEGEKMVTRHTLEQTRRNGDDLAAIKTRLDRVERKVDGLEQKVGGLEQKVGGLEHTVNGLAANLPRMITEAVREGLLRKRRGKS